MAFEHYIRAEGKLLRCGFTTGTCAALAAQGASIRLLSGLWPETLSIRTPKGLVVEVIPEAMEADVVHACCGVRKDAGDDKDQTRDALIVASVRKCAEPGVRILGGVGVGRVTKPGLDQPVGEAAINSVPRRMITEAVLEVAQKADYQGGLEVEISVPEGEEIAKHTFNEALGILGGISILGTSGIVEPMSVQALVDTIAAELRQNYALGHRRVVLTPGNYGMDYLKREQIVSDRVPLVRFSNYVGEALDLCAELGYEEVLIVGHVGKLVKLAGGIMNTHSYTADCRVELFCAFAGVCGAGPQVCRELLACVTTDACIQVLEREGLREAVMAEMMPAIQRQLERRVKGRFTVGALLFSNETGELGRTAEADRLICRWIEE